MRQSARIAGLSLGCLVSIWGLACQGPVPASTGVLAATQKAAPPPPLDRRATLGLDNLQPPVVKPVDQSEPENFPADVVGQAEERLAKQEFYPALQMLQQAEQTSPTSGRIQRDIGFAQAGMNDQAKAEATLQSAVRTAPDSVHLQLLLGQYAEAASQPDRAILHYRTAILCSDATAGNADTGEALLRLGGLLERKGYLTAALECYRRMYDMVGENCRVYLTRPPLKQVANQPERLLIDQGRVLLKLHQPKAAADVLERAYQCDKNDPNAGQLAVVAMLEMGDFARAEQLILEMALEPSQVDQAVYLSAELFRNRRQKDYPAHLLESYLRRGGREASFLIALVEATASVAGPQAAIDLLNQNLSSVPDNDRLGLRLADLEIRAGDTDSAFLTAAKLLDANPLESEQVQALLYRLGLTRPHVAADLAAKARASEDIKPAMLTAAGIVAHGAEQVAQSEQLLKDALAQDAKFWPAYLALEHLYASGGQFPAIDAMLTDLNKAEPSPAFKWYLTARAKFDQGLLEEAGLDLQKSLADAEQQPGAMQLLGKTLLGVGVAQLATRDVKQAQEYFSQAEKILSMAREMAPDDLQPAQSLTELYMLQHRYEEALRAIQSYLRLSPQSIPARTLLGRYNLRVNQIVPARTIVAKLRSEAPSDPDVQLLELRIDLPETLTGSPIPSGQAKAGLAKLRQIYGQHPRDPQAGRLLGALLANQKEYAQAADVWQGLYQRDSNDPAMTAAYLDSLIKAKRQDQAVELIRRIAAGPSNGTIMQSLLLENLLDMNRLDLAEQLLDQWLPRTTNRQQRDMLRLRALQVYSQEKKFDKAQQLLDQWITETTNQELLGRLRQEKLQMLAQAGQFDQAIEYAQAWRKNAPHDLAPQAALVAALLDAKQYDKILTVVDGWLAQPPEDAQLVAHLRSSKLLVLMRQKKFDAALDFQKQWAQADKDSSEPYRMAVAALIEQKRTDLALKLVGQWIDLLGKESTADAKKLTALREAQAMNVEILLADGKQGQAEDFARKLVKQNPDNPKVLRILYTVLASQGKVEQSLGLLERIYTIDPKDEGVNNDLGYNWADRGINLDRAEAMIRKALMAKPNTVAFKDSLGWVLYKQGRFSEAKSVFDQIVDSDSLDLHGVILDHAGDNSWRLGLRDEAVRLWTRSLELSRLMEKKDPETRRILQDTPGKIDAARRGKEAKVAPLGQVAVPSAQ